MAFVDDVNLLLRDHVGYAGDGQGGVGALPVGDRNTSRNQIELRDLRELLIQMAQTMGDPSALQDILEQVDVAIAQIEAEGEARIEADALEALLRAAQDTLIAHTLAPVQERSAGLVDLPPILFGDREMCPTDLSFDLKIQRGYFPDTGLPWMPGGLMDDLFTVTEFEGRPVSRWTFDGKPIWDDETAPQMQVEVVSPRLLYVYIRQFGVTYVRWALHHDTVPERNFNGWRIGQSFKAIRSEAGGYMPIRSITFNGETDVAILLKQSIGGPNKPDHIGGLIHGNEELTAATLLINGAVIDPTVMAPGISDANTIELLQASDMYEPGNTSGTVWAPKGPLIMRHYKRLRLSADGWWDQWGHVDHIVGGFEVFNGYFGMLCLDWGPSRGHNSVHTAAREPLWALEDISIDDFPEIRTNARALKAWGDEYSGEVQVINGWSPDSEMRVDNRGDRRKIYPNLKKGVVTAIDAPWDIHVRYCINIKEAA